MKRMNKMIALFLCVLMLVAVLPAGVFAEDATTEETEVLSNDFDISLPFDDIGSAAAADYVTAKGSAYNLANFGSSYSTATEDGNVYATTSGPTGKGMVSFKNSNGYLNFDDPFQISFRMKLGHKSDTLLSGLYLPVIRLGTGDKNTGTGTLNLLVIGTKSGYVTGSVATETERGVIGELMPGKDATTTYTATGFKIYADTWYDVVVGFNPSTKEAYFTATDGVDSYAFSWTTSLTLKPVDSVMLFRTYGTHDAVKCLDDVCLKNVNMAFSASNDMNSLEFATGTNEETSEPETYTYPSTTPALSGFAASGVNDKWELVEETDEEGNVVNKYIKHIKNATAAPLTWKDNLGMIDQTPFEVSWRFKWGTVNSTGAGMFSVKLGNNPIDELRIINMKGDGNIYFGPGAVGTVQIAQLTTDTNNAENGGAQWHDIKVQLIPHVTETVVDMCYRFWVDGDLVAYTQFDGDNYNFYTKASGSWACKANLNPVKYVEEIKSGEDTNGNGVLDEGEDFTTQFNWKQSGVWGNDANNTKRIPFSLWDGYEKVYLNGTSEKLATDGVLDGIASIYMFHYNTGEFCLDDLRVSTIDMGETIESVEMLGYQLGSDDASVRFVAGVDSLDFGQVGMDVQVFEQTSADGWVTKVDNSMTNAVYMALNADGEDVTAIELGAKYFAALAITEINSSDIIRIRPYVTKNTVRIYGESVVYAIDYDATNGVSVSTLATYVNDFSNGVTKGGITDGYKKSTYAQLIAPDGDWGSGGEGGSRVVGEADGAMKINVSSLYHYDPTTTNEDTLKKWYYTYTTESVDEETGEPVTTLHTVKDADGNAIPKQGSMSARYKIAHVIPYDYTELMGKTLIISAKVKVAEVKKSVKVDVEGYTGEVSEENKSVYQKPVAEVDSTAKATIGFGFFEDVLYSFKGTEAAGNVKYYELGVSDEWVELVAAIEVTEELVAGISKKNDDNGIAQPIPLRPTLQLGNPNGWASVLYVDDVTCMVAPTIAE